VARESWKRDLEQTKAYYRELFEQHGDSEEALGWSKGRQRIRFSMLLTPFRDLDAPRILDIGCGRGDLNRLLREWFPGYSYVGIDVMPEFVEIARERYREFSNVEIVLGDFVSDEIAGPFDVVVASGTFNTRFPSGDNRNFVRRAFSKAFELCTEGVAFDFLSDKVDFTHDHAHYSNPEDMLSMAYEHTRNVMLLNHYLPFEFGVIAFKDDSFLVDRVVFKRFADRNESMLSGL
jgi:SAM-dependent methyltransferase